jgi:hypothetical protein
MKIIRNLLIGILIILSLTFCTQQKAKENQSQSLIKNEIKTHVSASINTNAEIKVYNDFIDQVYNVHFCHLEMESPSEKFYKVKVSKKEYNSYKKEFDKYLKGFDQMLDTSRIIAFVADSLYALKVNVREFAEDLDSTENRIFHELVSDSIDLKSAAFILDTLKSNRIYFERPLYKHVDWDKMPTDTALKYSDQNERYWHNHVGCQLGNNYYIGSISMSRIKFNHDSTLCFLECGYTAQSKCGYGHYYFLQKLRNKWVVKIKLRSWLS